MKSKKKKYNPLKKYQEGGETPKKSRMQQAIDAGIASGAPKEKGPQNMMLGRTYIPRMSQQDKQQILDAGKALVDRMRKRKKFIEEGGTGKEFRQGLREERRRKAEEAKKKAEGTEEGTEEKEMTSSEKLRDFAENEMEDLSGFDEEGDRLDEELADEEPEEENIAKYGAKILKKYAMGGLMAGMSSGGGGSKKDTPARQSMADKVSGMRSKGGLGKEEEKEEDSGGEKKGGLGNMSSEDKEKAVGGLKKMFGKAKYGGKILKKYANKPGAGVPLPFSYGGKILKKYAKGGETDPPKKESSAEKTANKVRAQVAKQDSAKAYQAKMAAFAGYSSDRKDNVDPSEVYDFALNKLEKTREDRVKKILEKKHGISTAKPAKKITPNIKIKKAKR